MALPLPMGLAIGVLGSHSAAHPRAWAYRSPGVSANVQKGREFYLSVDGASL